MSNLTRYVFGLALILGYLGYYSVAQSQTKPIKKTLTGTVSGRVTIKGKGAPGVVVGLRTGESTSQPGPLFKATTDQDGKYRIIDVPAGNYQVGPIAPAFVISDAPTYGSRGRGLVITEGEAIDGLDFALLRGGVITGKVTDAEGRALIDEPINLFRVDPINQRGSAFSFAPTGFQGFQTDDRGIYRIFGVPAGRYKVGQSEDSFFRSIEEGLPSYKQTFHPDVTDLAKATVIELAEGAEATNIDITVGRPMQSFAARGKVVDGDTGQPVTSVRLGLEMMIDEQNSFIPATVASNSLGEFRIGNLTPGKYSVVILPQQESALRADAVAFEVTDQDVTGLLVKTSKGASLAGTVVLEGADDKTALTKLGQLRVQAYVQREGLNSGFVQSAPINADGSFRVGGLGSGIANLSLGAQDRSLLKGFGISRIERDGIVQARTLEIRSGEQITGVRVVVSYGTAIIRGVVKFENGSLPSGAQVVVRLMKPGETSSEMNMRPSQVDSRGHFVIEGVAAGSYELNVSAYIPGLRNREPSARQQINVTDGVVTEVTVTLDLNQNPGPPNP
jgi:hypothetical protein